MPGYQPRMDYDPVWWNGSNINTFDPGTNVGIQVQSIFGWDDRVEVRDVREPRHSQDGEHADNVFLGGRTLTIEGTVFGSTWGNLQTRKRALAALFNPQTDEVLFKVPEPDAVTPTGSYTTTGMADYERVSARVIESITFGDLHGPAAQSFQVIVRASDPRIYSDVVTSTDSGTTGTSARTVVADQGGTYETPPSFTVTGPTGSAWSVTEPLSGLVVGANAMALLAAETVAVDVEERTAILTSTYSGVRLKRSDVLALWMLAETSGTTADNAEGTAARDGTYTGGFTLNQAGPASGIASVAFNGSTGYVTVPYAAALNPTTFTVEGWFKLDTLTGDQTIISNLSGAKGFRLYYDDTTYNKLVMNIETDAGSSTVIPGALAAISAGVWYHFAITFTPGANGILYLNGTKITNGNAGTLDVATSAALQFGHAATGQFIDGNLAAFAMYSTAVSAAGALDLYEASAASTTLSAYSYLDATTTRWAPLGTASSTYTLTSSGLNTGSKLNVTYRDARL